MADVAPELQPAVTAKVAQKLGLNNSFRLLAQLILMLHEIGIHKALYVVLVSRPQSCFLIPNSVEGLALHHQILRPGNFEVRVYFGDTVSTRPFLDAIKIQRGPPFYL